MKIIFFCYRSWAIKSIKKFIKNYSGEYKIITTSNYETRFEYTHKKNLCIINDKKTYQNKIIKKFNPNYIFLIGWSWIIDNDLIKKFKIFCFHPSDLPNYRGGSPIQNQILNNIKKTKMTMFKINRRLDGGPIYAKKDLNLNLSMKNIFKELEKTTLSLFNQFMRDINNQRELNLHKQNLSQGFICKRISEKKSYLSINDLKKLNYFQLKNLIRSLEDPYPNLKIFKNDKTYLVKSIKDVSKIKKEGFNKILIFDMTIYIKLRKI